jgi:hypothetical protein
MTCQKSSGMYTGCIVASLWLSGKDPLPVPKPAQSGDGLRSKVRAARGS